MPKKNINLDDAAEQLFQELNSTSVSGGGQPPGPAAPAPPPQVQLAADPQVDRCRMLLVDLVHHLSALFKDVQYWEGVKGEKDTFVQLLTILHELSSCPNYDSMVLIRYRGMPTGPKAAKNIDYVVSCGDIIADNSVIPGVIKRMGIRMSHLAGRLTKACAILSDQGISNLYLRIPAQNKSAVEQMRTTLAIASRFAQAIKSNQAIVFYRQQRQVALAPVLDALNQPDPNLTLVAGLNGISGEKMQVLVKKVHAWMQRKEARTGGAKQPSSIFNALFSIKSLKGKLIKPPIEMNNLNWLMVEGDQSLALGSTQPAAGAGEGGQHPTADRVDVMAGPVAPFDRGEFDQLVAKIPDSQVASAVQQVAEGEFEEFDTSSLGQRLQMTTDLLAQLEQNPQSHHLLDEILKQIRSRFSQVQDDVFDDVAVQDGELKIHDGQKETIVGKVHGSLARMISVFKGRSATEKKKKAQQRQQIDFVSQDHDGLAQHFGMEVDEVKEILALLEKCFDARGHFNRTSFEKSITEFARYEAKIFEFLWQYLKEPLDRNDRVAFLNALQLLVRHLKQPKKALRILLADLCDDPTTVGFSDRNSLMLANMLVRKYNKELDMDIEITPEEVLLVQEGLDPLVTQYVAWRIDSASENFSTKIATIRTGIAAALNPNGSGEAHKPLRYLLALEREIHILLGLVGGNTARKQLRAAVEEYANPDSGTYKSPESSGQITALLQHLVVAVRGLGRLIQADDLDFIVSVRKREKALFDLGAGNQRNQNLIKRIMDWVENMRNDLVYTGYQKH